MDKLDEQNLKNLILKELKNYTVKSDYVIDIERRKQARQLSEFCSEHDDILDLIAEAIHRLGPIVAAQALFTAGLQIGIEVGKNVK